MANVFKDISQFTLKSAATGTEEFQVSATEKVTAQQIADLANSELKVYTISESEAQNQQIDASHIEELKKSAIVLFPNEVGYIPYLKVTADDSEAYFITGNIPINSQGQLGINDGERPPFEEVQTVMIKVDLTTRNIIVQPYPVVKKEWLQTSDIIGVVEITDFAIPSVNITKDGQSFLFYANDASNIPNSNHGATSFVGIAIASPIFITGGQRLLYYMMIDTAKTMFYTGYANLEDDTVTWSDTSVTRLGQAVQVIAFTEGALSALLYSYKPGDFIPFYTGNVTASTANQFPESGVFNGFISMGSNEGDYFQIFAFKTGSPNAYIGACIGSTTRWTQIGGSPIVQITEYGGLYDATELVNAPTGSITAFHAEGTSVDGDLGPFGGRASAVSGIYIATEGSDYLETRSGIIIAYRADGEKGMAYAHCYGTKSGGGGIHSTDDWMVVENGESSGGVEKLSTWLEQDIGVAPLINIGFGEVRVPLNRTLKESDILRIDFMRRSEIVGVYVQGVAIVHVGAADNSLQDGPPALDVQYVNFGIGEFAALSISTNNKLIGNNFFELYINTNGSVPQDDYYIMGVYNISGQ